MANYGKISRLPHEIRSQLHQRLLDQEPAEATLQWLNSLPAVRSVLAQHFQGRPITDGNLSDYKLHGGFRDWLDRRNAREFLHTEDPQAPKDPVLDNLTPAQIKQALLVRLAAAARNLPEPQSAPESFWKCLHQLLSDLSRLERDDLRQKQFELAQQRWAFQQAQAEQRTEAAHRQWSERPDIRAWLYRGLAADTMALVNRDRALLHPSTSVPPAPPNSTPKAPKP